MKIDYLICDICGNKIDTSQTQSSIGQFSILKYKKALLSNKPELTKTPFDIKKVTNLSPTEILEKIEIDLCHICSDILENKCLELRENNEKKQASEKE